MCNLRSVLASDESRRAEDGPYTMADELMFGFWSSIFAAAMISAAVGDLATLRIPNSLVIGLATLSIPFAISVGIRPQQYGLSAMVAAAILLAGFAAFAFGALGAGDVKLAAATSLWLSAPATLDFLAITALAGALVCALMLALRVRTIRSALPIRRWRDHLSKREMTAPYGVAIAIGGMAAFAIDRLGPNAISAPSGFRTLFF